MVGSIITSVALSVFAPMQRIEVCPNATGLNSEGPGKQLNRTTAARPPSTHSSGHVKHHRQHDSFEGAGSDVDPA
jgi:hypothetical protein